MAEKKTRQTTASVNDFIDALDNQRRQQDSRVLVQLMQSVSGEPARMWGPSIIGFGEHFYRYANGKQTSICKIGFSPRVNALSFYLAGFNGKQALLEKLGKYRSSKACLYINKLDDVNLDVLRKILEGAWNKNAPSC
ncbi:MAG: DUF1801 domain-containing protein [Pseudomonadales bacterium]|nr:DUF1801 domain-containing protein [Pseudomonadales bacterium]